MLAAFGVLQISAGVDKKRGTIIQPVRITTRGWFEGEHDKTLLELVTSNVRESLDTALREGERDPVALNKIAQRTAGRLLGQKYRRQPVLLAALAVFGVAPSSAPERLVTELLFLHSAISERDTERAHDVELAKEVGVALVSGHLEGGETSEQPRRVVVGAAVSLDEDARHAEALVKGRGERIVDVVHFHDKDCSAGGFDALSHAVERGEATGVA